MKLGEKLNQIIKQRGMSINQVAVEANVPPSSLYSIIQRNSTKVEIDSFIRICNILGCKPEDFSEEILAATKQTVPPNLTEDEQTVINNMRQMTSDGVRQVVRYTEMIVNDPLFKKESDTIADEA